VWHRYQMRLGWEAMWDDYVDDLKVRDEEGEVIGKVFAVADLNGKCVDNADALRFQFGAGSSSENVLLS
jgi:hypothetical protein